MALIRKIAMVGAAAVAALMLVSTVALSTASAQAALPYKAYGSGLKAGQVVEAERQVLPRREFVDQLAHRVGPQRRVVAADEDDRRPSAGHAAAARRRLERCLQW